jgi:hypothetical protein
VVFCRSAVTSATYSSALGFINTWDRKPLMCHIMTISGLRCSCDTSSTAQDTANHEVNLEPQRHNNQAVYDQCWAPILQPERLLPPAASAYNDQYQSHVGGVRISCHPEVVRGSCKGQGKRGSGIAHFASTVGSVT